MTNKELEKLFQNKLGNRTFKYNPEAWTAMEKILDAHQVPWYLSKTAKLAAFAVAASMAIAVVLVYPEKTPSDLTPPVVPITNVPEQNEVMEQPQDGSVSVPSKEVSLAPVKATFEGTTNQLVNKRSNPSEGRMEVAAVKLRKTAPEGPIQKPEDNQISRNDQGRPLGLSAKTFATLDFKVHSDNHAGQTLQTLTATASDFHLPIPLTKAHARRMHHQFFVTGGLSVANGLNGNLPVNELASGLGFAGFRYRYVLNRQFTLSTGAIWSQRGALNTNYVTYQRLYGFGTESMETHHHYKRLTFAEVPVTAEWTFAPGKALQAGVYAARLLQADAEVHRLYHLAAHTLSETDIQKGVVKEGFNEWHYGLMMGYEQQIYSRLHLGIQGMFGVSNLLNPSVFSDTPNNFQARLVLSYKI
jgi:hypothetical protein